MAKFTDYPKSDPADVIRQVLDGIESGADEVLADEMTRDVRAQLGKPLQARSGGMSQADTSEAGPASDDIKTPQAVELSADIGDDPLSEPGTYIRLSHHPRTVRREPARWGPVIVLQPR
jgi:hypothetical protein